MHRTGSVLAGSPRLNNLFHRYTANPKDPLNYLRSRPYQEPEDAGGVVGPSLLVAVCLRAPFFQGVAAVALSVKVNAKILETPITGSISALLDCLAHVRPVDEVSDVYYFSVKLLTAQAADVLVLWQLV